jgi:WD40 repeat protein
VASGSYDNTVRLWDAGTGALRQMFNVHLSYVTSVAFSPDGKLVASGSYGRTVQLWDAGTGAMQQTPEGDSSWVRLFPFLSDGRHLVFVSNEWVKEGRDNILWLPADYRATCEAVWKREIALGHSSGTISFLRFEEGSKLI